jgi:hypothetical protein
VDCQHTHAESFFPFAIGPVGLALEQPGLDDILAGSEGILFVEQSFTRSRLLRVNGDGRRDAWGFPDERSTSSGWSVLRASYTSENVPLKRVTIAGKIPF